MSTDFARTVDIFKAFGDVSRMKIVMELQNGECTTTKLLELVDVNQSTLSHHMKILRDTGFVTYRKEGRQIFYRLSFKKVDEYAKLTGEFWAAAKRANENSKKSAI